jgi:glutathione S-transferase
MDDVFQPSADLLAANPLARVPVASLRSGVHICESQQILNAAFGEHPSPEEAAISGLATGLCDKIVERLLESLRPQAKQDLDVFSDFERLLPATLQALEKWAHTTSPRGSSPLRQAQIDTGVALAYLSLRVSIEWKPRFPACARLLEALEDRESFKKTAPPPA